MSRPVQALNLFLALLIALAIAAVPAPAAHAATIGVDTNADELTVDGNCSLREAIRAANLNAAVDACPSGSGAASDTITLPPDTYTLSIPGANEDAALSGDLDITGDLTITGALSTTTIIDGGALDRVYDVISGTVTIANVTVRNGSDGGIF
ncbi:MAG TPA: CSLREA domain-containing protein, partial [Roseiflexaceae bacterium]